MTHVVIGSGVAGNEAAETLKKHSPESRVLLLSREPFPSYSACALPDFLAGWASREKLFIKSFDQYREEGIETRFNETVESIDLEKKRLICSETDVSYDTLIIATGSSALVPPLPGSRLEGNHVLKSMADMDTLSQVPARQVVVIGSGNIGMEAAEAMHLKGCQVTVVELLDRIMPKVFDPPASAFLQRAVESHGIRVLCSEKVEAILGDEQVHGVQTSHREIPCDTVIWAVGVRQNTQLAKEAGLEIGELGGILVDKGMHTSHTGVFACGDCVQTVDQITGAPSLSLLWPSARQQGRIAACNALGKNLEYEGAFTVVMEEICGLPSVSLGRIAEAVNPDALDLLEFEDDTHYRRVVLDNGIVAGYQNVGIPRGAGSMLFMIKNQVSLAEIHRWTHHRDLALRMPHYLVAGRLCQVTDE